MASVEKRKYWVGPDGKPCRKGTPGAVQRTSRYYSIIFTDPTGKPVRRRGYTELRASQQLAARLEKNSALGHEGMLDIYAEHKKRPLLDHLADYLDFQTTRGRDDKYRYTLDKRIRKALAELGWKFFADINGGAFEIWMAEYAEREGVAGGTVNQFLDSMRAFLNWACDPKRKRFPANPLVLVEDLPHAATFRRRALTEAQVGSLLACACSEHSRVYKLALATGLRRQELADLQWGDVVIDCPVPFLKLRAAATKGRRADTLPLRTDVAADLLQARPAVWCSIDRVFHKVPTVAEFRDDLRIAGVAVGDDEFDRVDFHGLRTTLGSLLAKAGTAPRVAMELMRRTDMRLTQTIYTDPRIFDTAGVVNALPLTTQTPEKMRATGTNGGADGVGEELAEKLALKKLADTRQSAPTCTDPVECKNEQTPASTEVCRQSASICADTRQSGESSASRTRTYPEDADLPQNLKFSEFLGQKSDTASASNPPTDAELVMAAWPTLSTEDREKILAIVRGRGGPS